MNDAFSLASTGRLDFAVALETMNFLQRERGAFVWQSAIKIITKLYTSLGPTAAYPLFEVLYIVDSSKGLTRGSNQSAK